MTFKNIFKRGNRIGVDQATIEEQNESSEKTEKESNIKDVSFMHKLGRVFRGIKTTCKILLLIYLFMCGIDVLTTSFKMIGGKNINALTKRGTLNNPLVGLIVGLLMTVMVQSSSTATAIIVSLVSSGVINIQQAIPVVMGSNIGTSVTNTFVAFTQVKDREMFRLAFAGATVHDMFNWLCVSSLLSVEIITRSIPGSRGLLEFLTELSVNATYSGTPSTANEPSGLKEIVTPVTSKIIKINAKILECWARNESSAVTTIIERYCDSPIQGFSLISNSQEGVQTCPPRDPVGADHCCFLFASSTLSDLQIGVILLVCSLGLLIACLITLVKVLNAVMQGAVQEVVKKYINSDIPCAPYLTGYCALIVGAVLTIVMQSSSIFTSLLTPLIGMGVVSIERCYPLTLGSNIGTTATALLAAFTENSKNAVQIALVHLFFNVFGILLFYPVPFMRFPIPMCKKLGSITSKYRWFAIFYLVFLFIMLPCIMLLLSKAGVIAFWTTFGIAVTIGSVVLLINILQTKRPSILPSSMHTWEFLPLPLRSLEPYDKVISMVFTCGQMKTDELPENRELRHVVPSTSSNTISSLDSGIDNLKENTGVL